jgi:C1A family cysteine protease
MKKTLFVLILAFSLILAWLWPSIFAPTEQKDELPRRYDLREIGAIPGIREQAWGTCWIFATYLSLETNLSLTGEWKRLETGPASLAPYHLDKFSGFTRRGDDSHVNETWYSGQGSRYPGSNTDDLEAGLIVHLGGDFRASAAFLTNTRGAVQARLTPSIPRSGSHVLFGDLPTEGVLLENNYTYFFPRKIQWLTLEGSDEQKRRWIKEAIINHGAVASAQVMEDDPLAIAADGMPIHGTLDPEIPLDHAINLIGWDDDFTFGAHRGAWIAQDSDHRTSDDRPLGHFYVLYDDVSAAKDPWMGGVIFRDVVEAPFTHVYSHSLHGFRYSTDPREDFDVVANRFVASEDRVIEGIGFYTASMNVAYEVRLTNTLGGEPFWSSQGSEEFPGFHYLDVSRASIPWSEGDELFVELRVSDHQYAYSASSTLDVLLGGAGLPEWGEPIDVHSRASTGEGFYRQNMNPWEDFSSYVSPFNAQGQHPHAQQNPTANWAINVYTN